MSKILVYPSCLSFIFSSQPRERSSITSAHWRGVGGLTENADAADAFRGGGGSQVKIDDVILEHIC